MRVSLWLLITSVLLALERPGVEFRIYQFPPDAIPRVDGRGDDWEMVGPTYVVGMDQLKETVKGRGFEYDRRDLDVAVRVGWVKGMNRLYFLYEASDDYWDFAAASRHNDIFELVVDGDLSGGPLIAPPGQRDAFFRFQGVHAQNYHIFTPAPDRDWAMVWGCQPWIKELPYANAAYRYDFRHGEGGRLTLEFWITPFDYAPWDGPGRAVESKLRENQLIGLSWAVLDYDGPGDYKGFWNLSHKTTMYGDASDLVAFRLMPPEPARAARLQARWSFSVLSLERREVAFRDESTGAIRRWWWDFGDGETSTAQHPVHRYAHPGEYVVKLVVEGDAGKAQWTKVRDVVLP
jgi:hypothetical protein